MFGGPEGRPQVRCHHHHLFEVRFFFLEREVGRQMIVCPECRGQSVGCPVSSCGQTCTFLVGFLSSLRLWPTDPQHCGDSVHYPLGDVHVLEASVRQLRNF